jgi:hypothetical protein
VALFFDGASAGTTLIRNNIVVGHYTGILYVGSGPAPIVDHNDVFSDTSADYINVSPGAGAIAADPLFANPNADNYHVQSGSPAINAGSNEGAPPLDHDGILRPQQGTVDMGAYERPGPLFLPIVFK